MTVEVAGDVRPWAIVDCLPLHRARYAASRAVALSLTLFVAACSSDPDRPAGWTWPDAGVAGSAGLAWPSEGGAGATSCDEGAEVRCFVVYDQANGIRSCWEGVRTCRDGRWSTCEPTSPHPDLPELH